MVSDGLESSKTYYIKGKNFPFKKFVKIYFSYMILKLNKDVYEWNEKLCALDPQQVHGN